jgi:hypothetical protein
MARSILAVAAVVFTCLTALADPPAEKPLPPKLPLSGQPPAKLFPNICALRYSISTAAPKCQAFFDQGLAFFYSYDYGDAVRAFETAAHYDPDCAMAWWGLSRAFDRSGKPELGAKALDLARQNQGKAAHREQFLIKAMLQSKAKPPANAADASKLAAIRTIDELLSLYDDDEEGWYFRAQLAGGGLAAVPFYKALLRINPLHPGGTHELVHFYENRPALAWPYAENYVKGSPGLPHPYHMQGAHHAMRLGRWDKAIECFARSAEVAKQIGRGGDTGPLMLAFTHEGRFAEARKLGLDKKSLNWFVLYLAERNWSDATRAIDEQRKIDKDRAEYLTALLCLKLERPDQAALAVEAQRRALAATPEKGAKQDRRQLENRLWESEGLLLCQQGKDEAGLALLAKVVQRTLNIELSHDIGSGLGHSAYYMESWGIAALKSGRDEVAEEAFLEALAHDKGSARGALGMHILCERQHRDLESARFRDLARRCWQHADAGVLEGELAYLREPYAAYKKNRATPADK